MDTDAINVDARYLNELLNRVLPFGWVEDLPNDSKRFVTDHSGSIPFYYAQTKGRVYSGRTPLEVAQQFTNVEFDPVSVADFLVNGTVCFPHTVFKNVFATSPGSVTEVTPDKVSVTQYFRPAEVDAYGDATHWGDRLLDEVQRVLSVGLDGKSNVQVLFSGGEDSRAVTSLLPKDLSVELVTFADGYNREVQLAEYAAHALKRPLRFVRRPEGFYRKDIAERVRTIGGGFDIRHAHVWGFLADALANSDAVIGGYAADTLFKSAWMGNVSKNRRGLAPERLLSTISPAPVGIESSIGKKWLNRELATTVDERRRAHHARIQEFRPRSAGNWHTMWPLGTQRLTYAHYLAARRVTPCLIEPFLGPKVYQVAAQMPDDMREDRKAFRAAFGRSMGKAGWLPSSSGRIPRIGGYTGRAIESGFLASRRFKDRVARFNARATGKAFANQGAWSSDHAAFDEPLEHILSSRQIEQLRDTMADILTSDALHALFGGAGDVSVPPIVKNRALQIAYLMKT